MAKVVAMCGAHGTGKSTLVEELRKDPRCVCIDSVTRTNTTQAERRIDSDIDMDQTQLKILEAIKSKVHDLKELKYALGDDKIIVLDRSAIDFYAYCKNFLVKGLIRHSTFEKVRSQLWDLTRIVDRFFFIRPEFGIKDDGVRSLDKDLQKNVDQTIKETLERPAFMCRTKVISGTVEERMCQVNETLNSLSIKL